MTKRKPAEWLFGRPIRTRIPDIKLQTQRDDKESQEAKENIRNHGAREKERHDRKAREEHLEVGMKVLLKSKKKRKGSPKYDPEPYTISEMKGRQAVLTRGSTTIRRETQKFKRLYTKDETGRDSSASQAKPRRETDDWEERTSAQKPGALPTGNTSAPAAMEVDTTATADAQSTQPADTAAATVDEPAEPPNARERDSPIRSEAPTRRSTRTTNPPSRYGTWVEK